MRPIKFIINWSLILTMPVWCGSFVLYMFLCELKDKRSAEMKIAKGEEFLWKV